MRQQKTGYFNSSTTVRPKAKHVQHQAALERCVAKLRDTMPIVGLRNPKIGRSDLSWNYCTPYDWVVGFHAGQLWLALQLTGDPVFLNAARARRVVFRNILVRRDAQDHDLGFQFSLGAVSDWLMTGDSEPRAMALTAASYLLDRFHPEGRYLQAWNARTIHGGMKSEFANGRIIADTMQNVALLYWAHKETGRGDFREAADAHSDTSLRYLVRQDDTSFHTFSFDPATGEPQRGATHQGYADDSCWSRGQAWMIHGFAQSADTTGNGAYLDTSRRLAAKAEQLLGNDKVPVWDYALSGKPDTPLDSSAASIMAAGVFLLASQCEGDEAARWWAFGDRLLDGLMEVCDLTKTPDALGLLAHGAAHVKSGYSDNMLPYGDYYYMEALMRSLGHTNFFW